MSNPNPQNQFQPGNTAALGNDKTMRLSTWLNKILDGDAPKDAKGYQEGMTMRQLLAHNLVDKAVITSDPKIKLEYFKEIADRTEGRPAQPVDLTSKGERLFGNMTKEQIKAIADGRDPGGSETKGESTD